MLVNSDEAQPAVRPPEPGAGRPASAPRITAAPSGLSFNSISRLGVEAFHRLISKCGFVLLRSEGPYWQPLEAHLRTLVREPTMGNVHIIDDDPEPLRVFRTIWGRHRVSYDSPVVAAAAGRTSPAASPFLLSIEASALPLLAPRLFDGQPPLPQFLLVRAKIAQFWCGSADAIELCALLNEHGYELHDIAQRRTTGIISAAAENIYLSFRPVTASARSSTPARQRCSIALSHLSSPIVTARQSVRLLGRSTSGTAGGVTNPGALSTRDGMLLLARSEAHPWPVQAASLRAFFESCTPLLLRTDKELRVIGSTPLMVEAPDRERKRFEDFRLFTHGEHIYSNHSIIEAASAPAGVKATVQSALRTSVGVSRLEPTRGRLEVLGTPSIPVPTTQTEKNWAMFSATGRVHLLYSFSPYRLFATDNLAGLDFKPACMADLQLPAALGGASLRNSVNPIVYDDNSLLHIVHQVFPTKQYVFWAVLIDRRSLLPTHISKRPLLRGVASANASIVYACAVVAGETEIVVFGGLDDCAAAAWRTTRAEVNRHWQPLNVSDRPERHDQ